MSEQMITTASFHTDPVDDEIQAQHHNRALDDIAPTSVSILVSNGLVTLRGVVATYSVKAQILHAIQCVLGVQQVQDELLTDSELENRVGDALATDSRTRAAAYDIVARSSNGLVVLEGNILTYAIAEVAEWIAAGLPGVRAVSNRLRVGPQVGKRSMGSTG
jgi:osmotically-inducible protein OsmY